MAIFRETFKDVYSKERIALINIQNLLVTFISDQVLFNSNFFPFLLNTRQLMCVADRIANIEQCMNLAVCMKLSLTIS